jgi:uncharacterized phage protein (TIGR02220 family)
MRARNVKPGFFKNEVLGECSYPARLFFAGLWCCADRAGRLEDRPQRLKAEILPYDDEDAEALLEELASKRDPDGRPSFIIRYAVNGRRYIQIIHFLDHQNPHHREAESRIPAPGEPQASPGLAPGKLEENPGQAQGKPQSSRADSLIPDSLNPPSCQVADDPVLVQAREVIDHLNEKAKKGFQYSKASLEHICARLREGYSIEQCKAVIDQKIDDVYFVNNPKFLNPQTLFRPGNFEKYLNEEPQGEIEYRTGYKKMQ